MADTFREWLRRLLHKVRVNLTIGDREVTCEITVPKELEEETKPREVSPGTED